jgi:predicted metalloprotease with PDZ domain
MRSAKLALAVALSMPLAMSPASSLLAQTGQAVIAHILDEPGWIGITPDSTDPLTIDLVTADTPAARAGLLPGDRIIQIDGRPATARELYHRSFPIGEYVRLTIASGTGRLGTYTLQAVENPYAIARARADSVQREAEQYRLTLLVGAERAAGALPPGTLRLGARLISVRPVRTEPLIIIDGKVAGVEVRTSTPASASITQSEPPATAPGAQTTDQQLRALQRARAEREREVATQLAARRSGLVALLGSRTAIAGAEIAQLNADLGSYFGVAEGVFVLAAPAESPAAAAGLRAGDVIDGVNATRTTTLTDVVEAIASARGSIVLSVLRRGERSTVILRR